MNHVIQKAIRLAGSQANLAKMIGVGQSTISKWLNGAEISSRYISTLVTAMDGAAERGSALFDVVDPKCL